MTQSISSIVGELIELEPSLEPHRAQLEAAVREIMAAKPDTKFTKEFQKRLLAELRSRLAANPSSYSSVSFSLPLMLNKFLFAGGGAIVGALVVAVLLRSPGTLPTVREHAAKMPAPAGESSRTELESNAFGNLNVAMDAANPRPQGGGGGGGSPMMDAKISAVAPGILPPDMTLTEFVYDGEITLPAEDVVVMRRSQPSSSVPLDERFSGTFASGLLDLGSFGNMSMQSVSFSEGKTGYAFTVDFIDGSVWISRIYDPNERPESRCTDDRCFQQYRLKEKDMIADDKLIAIAKGFLEEHGVDLSRYGTPEVTDDWRYWMARMENPADYYYPEQLTVVFPMLIDGKPVYEEGGAAYGVQVSVDVRLKKVANVSNLRTYDFDTSSYDAASTMDDVRKALKLGGAPQYWQPDAAKTVTSKLGAPSDAYVHIYHWNQKTSTQTELFVPALAFPVTEMPKASDWSGYRKNVVLPLAEEMIRRIITPPEEGRPIPLDNVKY